MDGQLWREGDRYVLEFVRHLGHPPERVWRALTEPHELARWFPGRVRLELRVGGPVYFEQSDLDVDPALLASRGTISVADPPRRLEFTWGEDLLRFELEAEGDGCRLVFHHAFENRASAPRSAAGWHTCVDSLVSLVDGTDHRGDWSTYHARYSDELGADGTFTREGDRAVLRFERVLDRPPAEVWAALTETELLGRWLAEGTIEATDGGGVELHFQMPPGYVVRGAVRRLDPPRVLEYTWTSPGEPDGTVTWQLIPVGDRCILLFTHTVDGHWDEAGTLAAWHVHLSLLATALGDLAAGGFPELRWEELRRRYAGAVATSG